jgi:succinoglycan biosynthesis transport protein ExoP
MNFHQLFLIIKARRKIVISTMLLTIATAVAVSLILPKGYKATVTLVLNQKGADPVTGAPLPALLTSDYMATQVEVIGNVSVALRVVERLKLYQIPELKQAFYDDTEGKGELRRWIAELLLKKLQVTPARDSSVLDVSFTGVDPQFAAAIANAFAAEYQAVNIQLKLDPLRSASTYFNSQLAELRAKLEAAQNKLSQYQKEKGIVSVDNRLDMETARLNDLSTQLVVVQGQLMEASSRSQQAQSASASESPDVVANPLIQNLKVSLSQAEAKFSEISLKLAPNHPDYRTAEAEVTKLRSELAKHVQMTSNSVGNNARILARRESELRAALQSQKTKVLEINRSRDELAMLAREVESGQHAYDDATQRFNQTSLQGKSNQADVAVLMPAQPPVDPATPRLLLNTVLSVVVGMLLGLAAGGAAEFFDRRVRSAADLLGVFDAPMLGDIVGTTRTRRKLFKRKVALPWIKAAAGNRG